MAPQLSPENFRFIDASPAELASAAPGIDAWLQWVFAVMGGQMVAGGMLAGVAAKRIADGATVSTFEFVFLLLAGLATAALMSGVNFAIASDFRWMLLAPVGFWLIALWCLLGGGRRAALKVEEAGKEL